MKPLRPEDPETKSADVLAENVAALKDLFPEAFTEGRIDFGVLKQLLGGAFEEREEKYGLNWHGKRQARQLALTPSTGTLRPCPEESVDWDTTQNLMIEGDNLEVLKLLQKSYAGKVKLIYIDPPYNTGNDFVYPDNFRDNIQNYLELTGQLDDGGKKLSSNTEASGRFHTAWLNMMYPRLKLARNLLREDGVIFVSIDDNESSHLRLLLDSVFGEENFVASFVWQKMDSPSRNAEERSVSAYHEYIVTYARDLTSVGLNKEDRESILDAYPLTLPDGRKARRRQLRKNGKNARRQDRPTMWFPLLAPDGTEVWPRAPEGWDGRWVLSVDTWEERRREGLTEWIEREDGWVPYYIEIAPESPTAPWSTLWTDVDQNRQAKAEFTALMGTEVEFQTPKPTSLLRRILQVGTTGSDLVLDFFAGSGTTGQAVCEQNRDGSRRRFILIQLPEPTGQQEYPTIASLTAGRLKRAAKKIRTEDPLFSGDLGFRVFKLDSTNIRPWDPDRGNLERTLDEAVEHIKPERSDADVLFELFLKLGLDLTFPIETKTIAGKEVHSIGVGELIVCLAAEITSEEAETLALGIAEWHRAQRPWDGADDNKKRRRESTVVFRDSAFADDVVKTNLTAILEQHGLGNVRSL
jgi:adenine-specific DNA-methyltransferase